MYIFPLQITYFCSQLTIDTVRSIIMGNLPSACRKIRDDFNDAGRPQVRITLISAGHPDCEPPQPWFEGHPPLPPVYSTNSPPPYVDPPRYAEVDVSNGTGVRETSARRVRAIEVREREREREREVRRSQVEPESRTRTMRPWPRRSVWADLVPLAMNDD